jgi:hypothetical protein
MGLVYLQSKLMPVVAVAHNSVRINMVPIQPRRYKSVYIWLYQPMFCTGSLPLVCMHTHWRIFVENRIVCAATCSTIHRAISKHKHGELVHLRFMCLDVLLVHTIDPRDVDAFLHEFWVSIGNISHLSRRKLLLLDSEADMFVSLGHVVALPGPDRTENNTLTEKR